MDNELKNYITINREICGGAPVFKGTRVTVKTLFDYLEDSSLEEFLKGFPSVSRHNAETVIELASEKIIEDSAL
jgi:uncharacterized protein (DUF433 family)